MSYPLCEPGCACGKHRGNFSGKKHSADTKAAISAGVKAAKPWESRDKRAHSNAVQRSWDRLSVSDRLARGAAISKGDPRSSTSGRLGWTGGRTGEEFAKLLCPLGYVREYQVNWGPGGHAHYKLDFALTDSKVNIELDGPWHMSSQEEDALRDSRLRALGWHVIRVRHS